MTLPGRSPSASARGRLESRYRLALKSFLNGGGEPALRRAYELGRRAVAERLGVLDMALMHHAALRSCLLKGASAQAEAEKVRTAGRFLAESISPHEMVYRGYDEARLALRQVNELLEGETNRIAHALHDEAGELLVAAHLALADIATDVTPSVRVRLREVAGLLRQTEEQLRTLSRTLSPGVLADLGLATALRVLADRVSRAGRFGVRVDDAITAKIPGPVEVVVYRVVHEALVNVTRHARATSVLVRLRSTRARLHGLVRDDGIGIRANGRPRADGRRAVGLLGMRERIQTLGGKLEVDSRPGIGTEVRFVVPLKG